MECQSIAFPAMGGRCEIRVCSGAVRDAEAAAEAAIAEVGRIERKYSRYRADSIVGRVNAAAGTGEWIACDEETDRLLDFADTLHAASDGLFDISSGVLRRAWDFKAARLPEPAHLAELCRLIDWRRVERAPGRLRLAEAGMEIDFGGFGKEYAADRAASTLAACGIGHGYVNLGGDLRVVGPQADGQPWLIGIQDPRRPGALVATIPLAAGGLATSGDYEKFFELDGRRYCHILGPRTGMPVAYWRSVSVLAPAAIAAGSHATIAMLLESRGLDYLGDSGLSYLAIGPDGRIHTPGEDAAENSAADRPALRNTGS